MDEQEKNAVNPESGEQTATNSAPGNDAFWQQPKEPNPEPKENEDKKESAYSPYSSQQAPGGYYAYPKNDIPQEENHQDGLPIEKHKKKDKKIGGIIIAIILAVTVAFCGILGVYLIRKGVIQNPFTTIQNSLANKNAFGEAELVISDPPNIAEVDESDGLSAKEIYAKNVKSNVGIILYSSNASLFSQGGQSTGSNVAGEGSGIVMGTNKDGTKTFIITCAHVIANAKAQDFKVVVQDYTGKQYDAVVVGADSKTDIGVVAVEGKDLVPAEFGDSSKLVIGETVYAIGNPGGTEFFGSYTRGMISAIDRPVGNEIGYDMKSIQHDAAINPGNSGGMLINSVGQVVGINSSKIASTEYEGMGFSIPITSAKPIVDDLIANGYVTNRPKLGISYSPVSAFRTYAMVAHYNNLPAGSLIIRDIAKDSAFSGTKAQVGDLIIAVNGQDMTTADVLLEKIEKGNVGDELKLTICRVEDQTYAITKFDVTVKLVEDTGEIEVTQPSTQAFDWGDFFGY